MLAASLACDAWLVGDGLVGVAGEDRRTNMFANVHTRPTVMSLPVDNKAKTKIPALLVAPLPPGTAGGAGPGHHFGMRLPPKMRIGRNTRAERQRGCIAHRIPRYSVA